MIDNNTNAALTLDDSTIAQIARVLQLAIFTGTDISDNLRQLELEVAENGKLKVTEAYQQIFNSNIEKMVDQAGAPKREQLSLFD